MKSPLLGLLAALAAWTPAADALEIHGLIDLRLAASDAQQSWTRDGLDKTRVDRHSSGLRLGQGVVRIDGEVLDAVTAAVVVSANDDRRRLLDINEAWLAWNPVPTSAWKTRVKVGAFFPATNLEIDYGSIGWAPSRTLSSSAINSWMGEELRTLGLEWSVSRKGQFDGSSHSVAFNAAVFNQNDTAGVLLAWRGWSVSDRISGLTEAVRLADLPVYRPNGALPDQNRSLRLLREVDHRAGFYVGSQYSFEDWFQINAMHYDNRGEPQVLRNGQYSWRTRFQHVGIEIPISDRWVVAMQALRGDTLMGDNAVRLRYDAWYLLSSHALGSGRVTARFDRFRAREHVADVLPADPNGEHGRALALAYARPLNQSLSVTTEALTVHSNRPARPLIGQPAAKKEQSLTVALRWQF